MSVNNFKQCWSHFNCASESCPVYGRKEPACWTFSTSRRRAMDAGNGPDLEFQACLGCEIFQCNAPQETREMARILYRYLSGDSGKGKDGASA